MIETKAKTYDFPQSGGEMGRLIRDYDWSATPSGPVDQWPQSLRVMVDVIVHSQTPMLLWWGDQLIQFYNDAFRAALGEDGKHPGALGDRGEETWREIWHVIKPLIDRVRLGDSLTMQDQLIPIFRNGRIEDAYWTFGYSPVRDENGKVAGVLVICSETTHQVRAIERLQESERTLRSIVELAPVGICIVDTSTLRPEIVNDIFLDISGKEKDELLSHSIWQSFPYLKDVYSTLLEYVIRTGEPYKGHERRILFDRAGHQVPAYLDLVIQPLKASKHHVTSKLMIIAIDVTEKVLARQKIEDSEQRYRTLITESTVAIALYTGPDCRIQYVNEIMTHYWGKDESVVGQALLDAVPELKNQPFLPRLEHVYKTGETYVGKQEEAMLHVNGKLQPFYFNFVYKPLRDANGKIYGIHHMAMDVTEQVLARKKVEQNEATMRNIILKAPVAMCILRGPEFVVDIANDLMFQLWGKPREAMIHRPIFQGLPEVRFQGFEEILERVYATGESFSAEAVSVNLPREGHIEQIFATFLYEAYREADETVSGVFVVAVDVTEQVRARQKVEELVASRTQELADSNRNLQRSNDQLAQFAYIASHDLQEPARKITTFTEMLHRNLTNPDPQSQLLIDKIESSSLRMLSLIRDILAYSQLSKEKNHTRKIDLNEVLNAVLEDFELLIKEKKALIEADNLPRIDGTPVQISQLFANLISNSLKFTSRSRAPHIVIKSSLADPAEVEQQPDLENGRSYYKISFSDNGIGFSQKNARQIFDIFQRLHGKAEYQGTGIGLAMCKRIAQNHNGDIVAESSEGQGATFHVFLPQHGQDQ